MINSAVVVTKSLLTLKVRGRKVKRNVRRESTMEKIANIVRSRNARFCSRDGGVVS